ncbi:MAG: hypothetical protein AAF211_20010 [Myxococcota bacterium]
MRLKLLAPVSTPGFDLKTALVHEHVIAYERAAGELSEDYERDVGRGRGPRFTGWSQVSAVRFVHDPRFRTDTQKGSRYRSIDIHALERPLHSIELELRPAGIEAAAAFRACFDPTLTEPASALVETVEAELERGTLGALVRVFDHRVSLLELDLPIPPDVQRTDPARLPATLDALQQGAIRWAERLGHTLASDLVPELVAWITDGRTYGDFVAEPALGERHQAEAALWVTRTLVLEVGDPVGESAHAAQREAIVRHWLKDVGFASPSDLDDVVTNPTAAVTRWLNYFVAEQAYEGAYPDRGWRHDPGQLPAPFSARWDGMLIAQFYYAAFDQLQSYVSRILALSVSVDRRMTVSETKTLLDRALRDAKMLKVEFQENWKYYSRKVHGFAREILKIWEFEVRVEQPVDTRIVDCRDRLDELHARDVERSSVYTDLILLAIGVTAIFDFMIHLAELGRQISADPELAMYEQRNFWGVVAWLATRSTDWVLAGALVFTMGIIAIYLHFRSSGQQR